MFENIKYIVTLVGLALIIVVPTTDNASAISVQLAKKCEALTAKAFPPRELGNPAAGSAKGSGKEERAYYKKCVANGGKVPTSAR